MTSLQIRVRHDYDSGARRLAALPPRLDRAMEDANATATRIVENAVVALVEQRTSMGGGIARAITEAESNPLGNGARGKVSFKPPPSGGWEIRPKNKKALFWKGMQPRGGGKPHPVKAVRHPGSRPYALIGRGAQGSRQLVERAYVDEVGEVFR